MTIISQSQFVLLVEVLVDFERMFVTHI